MTGIYKIENLRNHKVYIGQAIDVARRIMDHKFLLVRNEHTNNHLQRAWNNLTENDFEFSIIEECAEEQLTEREQYWIDFYGGIDAQTTYNQREAGSHGRHSLETKEKISKIQRGVPKAPGRKVSDLGRKSLSLSHLGKRPSEETRRKMSLAQTGRKHTKETKQKISDTNKQRYIDNPALREEVSKRMSGRVFSDEHRKKLGDCNRGKSYKENTELIQKHSEGLKNAYRTGKKKAVWITVYGISLMQQEWADLLGINRTTLIYYRKKGEGHVEEYIKERINSTVEKKGAMSDILVDNKIEGDKNALINYLLS